MRVKFRLDLRKSSATKQGFPVIMYLTDQGKEKRIRTGYYAQKNQWDPVNALPLKLHPEYVELLNYLEDKKPKAKALIARGKLHQIHFQEIVRELSGTVTGYFYNDALQVIARDGLHKTYTSALTSFKVLCGDMPYEYISAVQVARYGRLLLEVPVNGKLRSVNGVINYLGKLATLWGRCSDLKNPFKNHGLKRMPTVSKTVTYRDLNILQGVDGYVRPNAKFGTVVHYAQLWMLIFYLGGIDMVDLVYLKKSNVVGGRVQFNRKKGGTNVFISNKIFPPAQAIIDRYTDPASQYLVPILDRQTRKGFNNSCYKAYNKLYTDYDMDKVPYLKAARYTFINRAKELMVDERICIEIVGHTQQKTHSIYTDEFSYAVRDAAHEKIIRL